MSSAEPTAWASSAGVPPASPAPSSFVSDVDAPELPDLLEDPPTSLEDAPEPRQQQHRNSALAGILSKIRARNKDLAALTFDAQFRFNSHVDPDSPHATLLAPHGTLWQGLVHASSFSMAREILWQVIKVDPRSFASGAQSLVAATTDSVKSKLPKLPTPTALKSTLSAVPSPQVQKKMQEAMGASKVAWESLGRQEHLGGGAFAFALSTRTFGPEATWATFATSFAISTVAVRYYAWTEMSKVTNLVGKVPVPKFIARVPRPENLRARILAATASNAGVASVRVLSGLTAMADLSQAARGVMECVSSGDLVDAAFNVPNLLWHLQVTYGFWAFLRFEWKLYNSTALTEAVTRLRVRDSAGISTALGIATGIVGFGVLLWRRSRRRERARRRWKEQQVQGRDGDDWDEAEEGM